MKTIPKKGPSPEDDNDDVDKGPECERNERDNGGSVEHAWCSHHLRGLHQVYFYILDRYSMPYLVYWGGGEAWGC